MARLFLVVREGDANETADDLIVVDDETLLRDVARLLGRRLGLNIAAPRGVSTVVPLVKPDAGGER